MPGLFDGFWRMVKGEPFFQAGDDQRTQNTQSSQGVNGSRPQQTPTPVTPHPITPPQAKPLPYVAITRWEHEYHGDNLQINLTLHNTSAETIELDRLLFLGQEDDLEEVLDPGEAREIKAYYGSALTSEAYSKAEVWYKDEDRCSFGSLHLVEYKINRAGKYEVARFRFLAPVRKYR